MQIVKNYGEHLEQVSIDEEYLDVTYAGSFEAATRLATLIKEEIRTNESLTC